MELGNYIQSLALILAAVSIWMLREQIRKQHSWNRRHATQQFMNDLSMGNLARLRRKIEDAYSINIHDKTQSYTTVVKKLNDKDKEAFHLDLRDLFNVFEGLCLGIKNNTLEEQICRDAVCLILTKYWDWGEDYIGEMRKNNPGFWIETEYYAQSWRDFIRNAYKIPRQPGEERG